MENLREPKISVVICFKDWGLERLAGVTQSILQSGLGDDIEVVISDYGSVDPSGYREQLEALGARYYYFATDGVWSRSRALNLGIKRARGEFIVTTDADMMFSPTTFPALLDMLETAPRASYILQCRDLPEGIDHEQILSDEVNWEWIDSQSKLRPRWGMGGLIAFPKSAYLEIRGLDERFEIYGGEDLDLAKRLVRAGYKRVWIEHPEIRMYHVWHPSSRAVANETPEGRAAISQNTRIHKSDFSVVRNIGKWQGRPESPDPLVTVAISTFNRASYILESIRSVQGQTFQDWELVVVNDGSTDETAEILESINDPRVRVFNRANAGLAASRNFITSVARGKYIAVHDDDDLMLPTRLEDELSALKPGSNGSYGAWVNFNNESGELDYQSGKAFSLESILFNSGVYLHPTLMVETAVLKAVPYNETMRSGSDYNLAVRMARAGVRLEHCEKIVMLRRQHDAQITNSHGDLQKVSGRVSGIMGRGLMLGYDKRVVRDARAVEDVVNVSKPSNLWNFLGPYLPDHLVAKREAVLNVSFDELSADQVSFLDDITPDLGVTLEFGAEKNGLYEFDTLSQEGLNELIARFGSAVIVLDLPNTEDTDDTNGQARRIGLDLLVGHETLWEQCSQILGSGVYTVIETPAVHSHSFENVELRVNVKNSSSECRLHFIRVEDVDDIDELTPSKLSAYKHIAGSNKISYIQKD